MEETNKNIYVQSKINLNNKKIIRKNSIKEDEETASNDNSELMSQKQPNVRTPTGGLARPSINLKNS